MHHIYTPKKGLDEPGTVHESGLIGPLTPTELVFIISESTQEASILRLVLDLKGRINGSFLKTVPSK